MDPFILIMLLAVGAMFLLTSRTRKQQRQAGEFRQRLEIGDDVMTGSGLFGTIVDIDGDVITLESPSGGRTDWLRGAIAKLAEPPYAAPEENDTASDEEVEGELTGSDDRDLVELDDLDVEEKEPVVADTPRDDVSGPGAGDGTRDEPRRP